LQANCKFSLKSVNNGNSCSGFSVSTQKNEASIIANDAAM